MCKIKKTVVLYEQALFEGRNIVDFYLIDGDYSHLDQVFFDIDD